MRVYLADTRRIVSACVVYETSANDSRNHRAFFGGLLRGHFLSCLNAPLTQTRYSAFCPLADIKKICILLNYRYLCRRNQYLKVMARYVYKSTRNYNVGFEWVSTSFELDYVHFRFTIETYRGINRSAWMTAKQAMKYISYGGLLYGYADSLRITKRITIYD